MYCNNYINFIDSMIDNLKEVDKMEENYFAHIQHPIY